MTIRSTVESCVYGSVGAWRVGASATAASDGFGVGVRVTLVTNPPSAELIPAKSLLRPPDPR